MAALKLAARLAALALLASAGPAAAIPVSFTQIADAASLPAWDGSASFGVPAIDGGQVAFFGVHGGSAGFPYLAGVYTGSGGALSTVVDSDTLVPGGSQPFGLVDFWGGPTLSQGNVAFLANEGGAASVFASFGGSLTRIATDDGSGNLNIDYQRSPMIDAQNVAFRAWGGPVSQYALFTSVGGMLGVGADATTDVPGGTQDVAVGMPFGLDGTNVAYTSNLGVYVANAGVARAVAETTTLVPGGVGSFTGFASAGSFDDGNVAFEGSSLLSLSPLEFLDGIYAEIDGALLRIVDTQTPMPGSSETFEGFTSAGRGLSLSGDSVAFLGSGGGGSARGLFVYRDGEIHEVILVGAQLGGATVSGIDFGAEGFSGDQLAFRATFDDGTQGVWVATIPEPGTLLLLGAGLAALAVGRRARG